MVLHKDTTRCRVLGSYPGSLDSESDALPLRHRALSTTVYLKYQPVKVYVICLKQNLLLLSRDLLVLIHSKIDKQTASYNVTKCNEV